MTVILLAIAEYKATFLSQYCASLAGLSSISTFLINFDFKIYALSIIIGSPRTKSNI